MYLRMFFWRSDSFFDVTLVSPPGARRRTPAWRARTGVRSSLTTSRAMCQFLGNGRADEAGKAGRLVEVHRVARVRHTRQLTDRQKRVHAGGDFAVALVQRANDQRGGHLQVGQFGPERRLFTGAHAPQAVGQPGVARLTRPTLGGVGDARGSALENQSAHPPWMLDGEVQGDAAAE